MQQSDLEIIFIKHLSRRIKRDGSIYGTQYTKDKLSRLRKLYIFFSVKSLANINDDNYFKITNEVISAFPESIGNIKWQYRYADYLVIIRLLYEMNNNGKEAKKYCYYGGVRVR